jgi:hypothetical protein
MRLQLAYDSQRCSEQRYGSKYLPQRHCVLPVGRRDQKQLAVPEPEFRPFELAYLPWDISDAVAALNGSRAIPTCVAWSPRALFLKEILE